MNFLFSGSAVRLLEPDWLQSRSIFRNRRFDIFNSLLHRTGDLFTGFFWY